MDKMGSREKAADENSGPVAISVDESGPVMVPVDKGGPVIMSVDESVLRLLKRKAKAMTEPNVEYNANTETFLKSVIADQQDKAADIENIVTNLLFGN